uniref:Solute carrier family 38 member 5 n=1 Tax=Rhinolophus ferrumequinum TaxID=59479 RepID=A0A671DQ16_RHIFE
VVGPCGSLSTCESDSSFLVIMFTCHPRAWFLKGNLLIMTVSVLIILPLALMRRLGYLGYTGGLSLTCVLFFLISVIYKKFELGCVVDHIETEVEPASTLAPPIQGLNRSCEAQMFTVDAQMFYTVPIMAFAFVCHPEVLPIYTELCRVSKRRMQAVASVSIGAMFCMYALTASFGYLTFYSGVEAEMLHTYSKRDLLILCVRLAVLLAVTLTVPVVLFPIRQALQQLLFPSKAFSWPRHVAIALILLVSVNVLVIRVPTIQDIFGIIGPTSAPSLIFILPSLFYLRIVPSEVDSIFSPSRPQALCFGVLGVLFMAVSLPSCLLTGPQARAMCLDIDHALLQPSPCAHAPVRVEGDGATLPGFSCLACGGGWFPLTWLSEVGAQRWYRMSPVLFPRDAALGSWP